ncbi:MAG: hypothetical protein RL095_1355 [Verrucomicrobiota bacterium]|jgi:FkbM family methyltransferase
MILKSPDPDYTPDESDLIRQVLERRSGSRLMIDVGANLGQTSRPFIESNWEVHLFEPDGRNRAAIEDQYGGMPGVFINAEALSDHCRDEVSFFHSPQSTGISSLSAFHETHHEAEKVRLSTLARYFEKAKMARPVAFLKVDTEGHDLFVLRGFPWDAASAPEVILAEFEDSKTLPLGYGFCELRDFLRKRGYQLLVSEWLPLHGVYGGKHRWNGFHDGDELLDPQAWGNLIAVRDPQIYQELTRHLETALTAAKDSTPPSDEEIAAQLRARIESLPGLETKSVAFFGIGKVFYHLLSQLKSRGVSPARILLCDQSPQPLFTQESQFRPEDLGRSGADAVVICSLHYRGKMLAQLRRAEVKIPVISVTEADCRPRRLATSCGLPEPVKSNVNRLTWELYRQLPPPQDQQLSRFLVGKSVVVIGPAPHLLDQAGGKDLDAFDVVVRLNKSFPIQERWQEFLGRRTNLYYHCMNQKEEHGGRIDFAALGDAGVPFLRTPYPAQIDAFAEDAETLLAQAQASHCTATLSFMEADFYFLFAGLLGTRPNTGIVAIADILRFPVKSLHVTGFTFFQTGYIKGYRQAGQHAAGMNFVSLGDKADAWTSHDWKNHNHECQKQLVRMLLQNDSRLSLDAVGRNILDDSSPQP